tara:strand:+ start:1611 stop:2369 length:759 start_codon:yes stop_codon:yes gene_type:complete
MLALAPAACAQMPTTTKGASMAEMGHPMMNPNSIQPETTLDISAEGEVMRAPDIAYITAGVQADAETARAAMQQQANAMTGVFGALAKAGVAKKDMQTSNFSLQPRYTYVEIDEGKGRTRGEQRLDGYTASNQLTVKVRDLDNLGATMDSLVLAGGNTFSGINFALDNDDEVRAEARRKAMENAVSKAKLYAGAAGLKVARIVTISEGGDYSPQPMAMMSRSKEMAMDSSTPISGGEVGYTARVNVQFELVK